MVFTIPGFVSMKRPCSLLLILLAAAVGIARADAPPAVGVAVPPQAGILQAMAPEGLSPAVTILVDGSQNPHSFEPSARQLAALSRCALYFSVGLPFETPLAPRIRSLSRDIRIVPPPESVDDHEEHDKHGKHDEHDPHFWTSPEGILAAAETMAGAMAEADSAHAGEWKRGYEAFAQRIRERESAIRERFASSRGRAFLVYHPAWGLFAETFGLRQLAIERHGGAPTAKHLAELMRTAKDEGVRALIVQSESEAVRAKPIAETLAIPVVRLNPLEADPVALLEATAEAVSASLPEPIPGN